jgi:hypothetical protein
VKSQIARGAEDPEVANGAASIGGGRGGRFYRIGEVIRKNKPVRDL